MVDLFRVRSAEDLGHGLRQARLNRGFTQTLLATKVGSHQRLVSRLETGGFSKTIDMLFRLLSELDLEIEIKPRQKTSSQDIADIFKNDISNVFK